MPLLGGRLTEMTELDYALPEPHPSAGQYSSLALCHLTIFCPKGHPSTCSLDIIVVPLPSILAALSILASVSLSFLRPQLKVGSRRSSLPKWLYISYLVLIICAVGMSILELVRLALDNQGVGLLPFNTVTFVFSFLAMLLDRHRHIPFLTFVRFRIDNFIFLLL
jgi:hypothetical protein